MTIHRHPRHQARIDDERARWARRATIDATCSSTPRCVACPTTIDPDTWTGWEAFDRGEVTGPLCNDCAEPF